MRRKPRILRCLCAAIVISILLWAIYQEFFVSHPKTTLPPSYLTSPYIDISYNTGEAGQDTVNNRTIPFKINAVGDIEAVNYDDTNKKAIVSDEQLNIIKSQIEQLKSEKNILEENIAKLKEENDKLGKINFDLQKTIIEFVEKHKIRDMLASAFIGALVSTILTFVLGIDRIRKKIIDCFFKESTE